MQTEVAIIGGGASGMMSAIACAEAGGHAVVLERKDRILKKVLATGNGRCNYSNIHLTPDNYYGNDSRFATYALRHFSPERTLAFFNSIGILYRIEDNGKVFPLGGQASAVADALRFRADALGARCVCGFDVVRIEKDERGFLLQAADGRALLADQVILATGGKAAPDLCSDGSGYPLAAAFGHGVSPLYPALVQLKTEKDAIRGLKGVKTEPLVSALYRGKILRQEKSDVLFTDYGISGSAVFQLSYLTALYEPLVFRLNFMPDYERRDLIPLLKERRTLLSYLTAEHFLSGMVHKKLGQALLKQSGIEKLTLPVSALKDDELDRLAHHMQYFDLKITGTTGFKTAQVTAGGLYTNEFDDKTMASKRVAGLYAVGELLDIFGDCGGYNLQWAWSSGYLAGVRAAGAKE